MTETIDKTDKLGVFRTIDGQQIRWAAPGGVVHHVAGADVHPGIRLLWTLCEIDVPANSAWLLQPGMHHEICITCRHIAEKLDALCSDCPPEGYPTDKTRCAPCPHR